MAGFKQKDQSTKAKLVCHKEQISLPTVSSDSTSEFHDIDLELFVY